MIAILLNWSIFRQKCELRQCIRSNKKLKARQVKESNIEYAVNVTESEPAGFETDQNFSGCYNGSFLSTSEFPDLGDIPNFDEIPDPNLVTDFGEFHDFDTDQESMLNQDLYTSVHTTTTIVSDQAMPLKEISPSTVPAFGKESLSRSTSDSHSIVVPLNNISSKYKRSIF